MLEFREPVELGFDSVRLEEALQIVEQNVSTEDLDGAYPGAVVMILRRGYVATHRAYGYRLLGPSKSPMTKDSIFDLASVTKPVATTSAFLKLLDMKEVGLYDPVGRYLPEFMSSETREIKMVNLLTHTSGLPSSFPLYKYGSSRDELIEYALSIRPRHGVDTEVEYSCIGFIILMLALERILGDDVSGFLKEHIFDKLGMGDTGFCPDLKRTDRLVATGERNPELWSWLLENRVPLHGHIYDKIAFGTVHDSNAMALGGISGNAGLFSTAEDLARFANMYLNQGFFEGEEILSPTSINLATTNYTQGKGSSRGLGWQLKSPGTSFGELISHCAYGHTGFTGTGIWIDPDSELCIILLTNRVYINRDNQAILKIRPLFIDNVISSLIE